MNNKSQYISNLIENGIQYNEYNGYRKKKKDGTTIYIMNNIHARLYIYIEYINHIRTIYDFIECVYRNIKWNGE